MHRSTTQTLADLDVVFGNIESEINQNAGSSNSKQHLQGILFAKVRLWACLLWVTSVCHVFVLTLWQRECEARHKELTGAYAVQCCSAPYLASR